MRADAATVIEKRKEELIVNCEFSCLREVDPSFLRANLFGY